MFQRRINGLVSYYKGADSNKFAATTEDNVFLVMNPQQHDGYMNAYIYDEELGDEDSGLQPGTKWADVPNDWCCPICGASKSNPQDWEKLEE